MMGEMQKYQITCLKLVLVFRNLPEGCYCALWTST